MKTLFKGGKVVNVFTDSIEETNVLVEDERIIGVGDYKEADKIIDVKGRYICPGFIDGHIHIESTMLTPFNFAKAVVPHGTLAVMADPHEIVNVAGKDGLRYMLASAEKAPMDIFFMLPSCVKVTEFDETGADFSLSDMEEFYDNKKVLGLAEVMNYPDVVKEEKTVLEKITYAKNKGKVINGHAPLLSGKDLDKYVRVGVEDDHECTSFAEALEKMKKGQWILVRQGTAAKNLPSLINCFDEPYNHRCLLATDDKEVSDILKEGHIDSAIRLAIKLGKNPLVAIRMATIQAASHFGLKNYGAIAPGYNANFILLSDLDNIVIDEVFYKGNLVSKNGKVIEVDEPFIDKNLYNSIFDSVRIKELNAKDFFIEHKSDKARVIKLLENEIISKCTIENIKEENNGIDIEKDILKIAVCERYGKSGNIGLGYIKGLGLKKGAIAISVSHDSHNLVIAGTNSEDMAKAGNAIKDMNGGLCIVNGDEIISLPLPIGGLMSDLPAEKLVDEIKKVSEKGEKLGIKDPVSQIMRLAFTALTCIPEIRLCTFGLFDVNKMDLVDLFV